jgi:hypothetical protein
MLTSPHSVSHKFNTTIPAFTLYRLAFLLAKNIVHSKRCCKTSGFEALPVVFTAYHTVKFFSSLNKDSHSLSNFQIKKRTALRLKLIYIAQVW